MAAVDVPEEVIREILLKVPVKSLLKLRCVSKTWLSLISTHQFAMAHLNISSKKKNERLIFGSNDLLNGKVKNLFTCFVSSVSESSTDLVYRVDDENPVYDELDCRPFIIEIYAYRWIVGSCNGLVCLWFTNNNIILWNPATTKFKKLPYSGTHYGVGNVYGFDYDKVHDDYKVVEFSKVNNYQLKVYSRSSNSWKVLGNWPGGDASRWMGQFLNGAIYWTVCRSPHWLIVAQDLASDEFFELPLPKFDQDNNTVVFKVEILDGCVALCCGYNYYMDVWVMKEYSWVKQLRIHFFGGFRSPPQPHRLSLFFCLSLSLGDGRILINHGTSLRIHDSTHPRPYHISYVNIRFGHVTLTTYVESLVSPSLDEAASSNN